MTPCRPHAVVCDFDGVLTDNSVWVNADGIEAVRCSRADGLAFDALNAAGIPCIIISTESNRVVTARANKLSVDVVQGVSDKAVLVSSLSAARGWDVNHLLFLGNDLNDLAAMSLCGLRACPADAHPRVRAICNFALTTKGGDGVMRELVEGPLGLDIEAILYPRAET